MKPKKNRRRRKKHPGNVLKRLGPLFNFQSAWREDVKAAADLLGWNWRSVFERALTLWIKEVEWEMGMPIYKIRHLAPEERLRLADRIRAKRKAPWYLGEGPSAQCGGDDFERLYGYLMKSEAGPEEQDRLGLRFQ